MKKVLAVVLTALIGIANIFAQESATGSIPVGRDIMVIAYNFSQNKEYFTEAEFTSFDLSDEIYGISGSLISKSFIGYQKRSYTVEFQSIENNQFNVTVSNMTSVACNKKGVVDSKSTVMNNPKSTLTKTAEMIAQSITESLSKMTDEEYENCKKNAFTDFRILNAIYQNQNKLLVNKYIEENKVIGSIFDYSFKVTSVDVNDYHESSNSLLSKTLKKSNSNDERRNFKYKVRGTDPSTDIYVSFYTNSESAIKYKSGSTVKVNVKFNSIFETNNRIGTFELVDNK